jgi:predicted Zn-ribbon and HTH transcriptional regulator
MVKKKSKSKKLILEDYKLCLTLAQSAGENELYEKLEKKIDQLENPPMKTEPREKTSFQCVSCKHKFKQVRNHCPTCDSEQIKKITDFT